MTQREVDVAKAILRHLKLLKSAGPVHEVVLLDSVSAALAPRLSKAEFDRALLDCDRKGWVIGVPGITNMHKWSLSDAGEVALIELS